MAQQTQETHPGIELAARYIVCKLFGVEWPLFERLALALFVLPIVPPALCWYFGVHHLIFLPAALTSTLVWWWLKGRMRYEAPTFRISTERTVVTMKPYLLDAWLWLLGGLAAVLLLLAVPVKVLLALVL